MNHQKGEESEENRNVRHESARISRSPVRDLAELNESDAMAVVFPGGFGAAKNLSDFGFKGETPKKRYKLASLSQRHKDSIIIRH